MISVLPFSLWQCDECDFCFGFEEASSHFQGFEAEDLYAGENFGKILSTLLSVNFATQGKMPAW